MINKNFTLLILGVVLLNILNFNIVSASSDFKYDKDYTLKSKDVKITVTDQETSQLVQDIKPNELTGKYIMILTHFFPKVEKIN